MHSVLLLPREDGRFQPQLFVAHVLCPAIEIYRLPKLLQALDDKIQFQLRYD
jgi:hypothetical protein